MWRSQQCTYTLRRVFSLRHKLDARGPEFKIIKTFWVKDKSGLPTHQAPRWYKGREKEESERVSRGRGRGEVWDWLEKRFDRRAKKNTDLIKVKYALPAMWVIILDLCINPFFLPALVGPATPGVHRVPPSHPTDFPTLAHRRGSTSGFCHPAPAFLLFSVLTWIHFQCTFSGVSRSFQAHAYEPRWLRLILSTAGIIMKP